MFSKIDNKNRIIKKRNFRRTNYMILEYKGKYVKKNGKKIFTLIDNFMGRDKATNVILRDKNRNTFNIKLEDFKKNYIKV